MRKLLLALGCAVLVAGVVSADPVTLVKYNADKKVVTVKDKNDKEVDLKISEKTKFLRVDKDGNKKDVEFDTAVKMLGNDKLAGKAKFEVTIVDGMITELTMKGGGKKN
jgi:hypothetical protein